MYKTSKDYQVGSFVPAQPIKPPPIDLGAVFGEQPTQRNSHTSPYERGLEFSIKYAPLFIIILILSIGLAWHQGWDVPLWLTVFGLLSFTGYWMLGFMENVFEPTSGHVVRYFFSWLVARQYIASNERLAEQATHLEYMRQYNEWRSQQILETKATAQIIQHSRPQSDRNRWANYTDVHEWQPGNEYEYPKDILEEQFTDKAREIVLDFTVGIYRENLFNDAGYIDNQSVTIPWGKKGKQKIDSDTRQLLLILVDDLEELYGYDPEKRQWKLNLKKFPNADSAIDYIDTVPTRKP